MPSATPSLSQRSNSDCALPLQTYILLALLAPSVLMLNTTCPKQFNSCLLLYGLKPCSFQILAVSTHSIPESGHLVFHPVLYLDLHHDVLGLLMTSTLLVFSSRLAISANTLPHCYCLLVWNCLCPCLLPSLDDLPELPPYVL